MSRPSDEFTAAELAQHAHVTERTVRNWMRVGVKGCCLGSTLVGGEVRIRLADYEAWLRIVNRRRNLPDLPRVSSPADTS